MPNSIASMSNFLLLQQSQNKLDNSPLSSPVHTSLLNNNLNTAHLYSSSSPSSTIIVASNANSTAGLLQGSTILNQAQAINHSNLLNNSQTSSIHSAYGALNFAQQSTPPLSLASTASSSLAITAPLHSTTTQQSTNISHQTPFVHLSQLNQQQQQYSPSNFYYSTLQPANRRVRVISNNLNGLTTIDDLHMHTDV